jgi:hypothetical protein
MCGPTRRAEGGEDDGEPDEANRESGSAKGEASQGGEADGDSGEEPAIAIDPEPL